MKREKGLLKLCRKKMTCQNNKNNKLKIINLIIKRRKNLFYNYRNQISDLNKNKWKLNYIYNIMVIKHEQ